MLSFLIDVKYWWLSLHLLEQVGLCIALLIEIYLIFVKKTPMATILASILFVICFAYFTNFMGINANETRGTLNLRWTTSGQNIVPNAGW